MKRIHCAIPEAITAYEIDIKWGLLSDPELMNYFASFGLTVAIVTDEVIASIIGEKLRDALSKAGLDSYLFTFPPGENYKTRETKAYIEDQMMGTGLGRDTCLIALGGGVVTDLGGYLASTYYRGIPLVLIPTTLLGMSDAAIGGKNAVNTPFGKNLIGTLYQPNKVIMDPSLLKSLPLRELRSGFVEMIKHGLVIDRVFFEYLEKNAEKLLGLDFSEIETAIFESCEIKIQIIQEDEKEKGIRFLLNFGHTIGHALEKLTDFTIAHGEAVAIGMLVEGYMAMLMGKFKESELNQMEMILKKFGLPLRLPQKYSFKQMYEAALFDKKTLKGEPRFVILDAIGKADPQYCMPVDHAIIKKAIEWMNAKCYA